MSSTRPSRRQVQEPGFVSTVDAIPISGDEQESEDELTTSRRTGTWRKQDRSQYHDEPEAEDDEEFDDDDETNVRRRANRLRVRHGKSVAGKSLRSAGRQMDRVELGDADDESDSDDFLQSDLQGTRKRKRTLRTRGTRWSELHR